MPCVIEKLEDTPIIKFHSNTLQEVRKEFGLDRAGMIDQSLLGVNQWLEKQHHIMKKDYSDGYIERLLISCKGSVERVKEKIDKMSTTRTLLPQFFNTFDGILDAEEYEDYVIDSILPKLTPKHERVYFIRNKGIRSNDLMGYFRRFIKMAEYAKKYDYCLGIHIILDFTGTNIVEMMPKVGPVEMQHFMSILMDAFSMRLKSMRFITKSKFIDLLVTLMKQVLSSKLGQRLYVHETIDEIYDDIPKDMWPIDYGGSEKSLKELCVDLDKALTTDEFVSYLKEMSKAVTNEELRSKVSYNEQVMGMPGSFRKLAVD